MEGAAEGNDEAGKRPGYPLYQDVNDAYLGNFEKKAGQEEHQPTAHGGDNAANG